ISRKSSCFLLWLPAGTHRSPHVQLMSARARVHGSHQHKARRKAQRHGGTGNRHRSVFEWLAQQLQNVAWELGEFIEEQKSVMRETDFTGPGRPHSSADKPGI